MGDIYKNNKSKETLWNIGKEYLETIWKDGIVRFNDSICQNNYELAYWSLKSAIDDFSPFLNETRKNKEKSNLEWLDEQMEEAKKKIFNKVKSQIKVQSKKEEYTMMVFEAVEILFKCKRGLLNEMAHFKALLPYELKRDWLDNAMR